MLYRNMEDTLSSASSSPYDSETLDSAPPFWKKILSKQLSMLETQRELAWERRRHQMRMQEDPSELCDDDLAELKACIELGFGFEEENGGHGLTYTLPALDLYFAVNRLGSPTSSPSSVTSSGSRFSGFGSSSSKSLEGRSSSASSETEDSWRICSPGEDPQQVKTKLRHWAQAVACSVMQSS